MHDFLLFDLSKILTTNTKQLIFVLVLFLQGCVGESHLLTI